MKAIFTQDTMDSLLLIRQSIGGAGFSAWSGIPRLIEDYAPNPTFEGDNTVMAQQCCNYLLKICSKLEKDNNLKLIPLLEFVRDRENYSNRKCSATRAEDLLNLETIYEAMRVNVSLKLNNITELKKNSKSTKIDFVNSLHALEMVSLATSHIRFICFTLFKQKIELETKEAKDANLIEHLTNLCLLYGIFNLSTDSQALYESGYCAGMKFNTMMLEATKILLKKIRPQAINLIES